MTIDTGALRKFKDIYAPIIGVIDEVLTLEAKKADLERWVAEKQREMTTAQEEIAAAYAEADERLAAHNEVVAAAQERVKAARELGDELKRNAAEEVSRVQEAAQARLDELTAAITDRQTTLAGLDAEIAKLLLEATAPREARIAELNATIKDLEKRQATAEKALDSLRAKLG